MRSLTKIYCCVFLLLWACSGSTDQPLSFGPPVSSQGGRNYVAGSNIAISSGVISLTPTVSTTGNISSSGLIGGSSLAAANSGDASTTLTAVSVDYANLSCLDSSGTIAFYGIYVDNEVAGTGGEFTCHPQNYGIYSTAPASTASVLNYSGYFDQGNFVVNGDASFGGSATISNIVFDATTGHVKAGVSSAVSFSSCGTGPACSSTRCTDVAGSFTTGTSGTTCTITFATTYGTAPACVISTDGSATMPTCTTSGTAITCTTTIASTKYHYICVGF